MSGSLALEGVIIIFCSADGTGVVICRCTYTVAAVCNISGICILCSEVVICKCAVALTAKVANCLRSTGSGAAGVSELFTLCLAAILTVLCLVAGSIYPSVIGRLGICGLTNVADCTQGTGCLAAGVSTEIAVGLVTVLTYSLFDAGSSAALMSECLTRGLTANVTVLCLGTGSVYPSVITELAVRFVTVFTNRL